MSAENPIEDKNLEPTKELKEALGSKNIEDWKENKDGIFELNPEVAKKQKEELEKQAKEADAEEIDRLKEKIAEDLLPKKIEFKEISPEFLENVESSKLDVDGKINLLLVKGGLKPTAIIDVPMRGRKEIFRTEEDLKSIESLIKDSGLAQDIDKEEVNSIEKTNFFIGDSKEAVERLKELIKTTTGEDRDREVGMLLGYPLSAVDAFVSGQLKAEERNEKIINREDLPSDMQEADAVVFSPFALSKENWAEEIKQGQIWADYIKSLSPRIYQEMIDEDKKRRGLQQEIQKGSRNLRSILKMIFGV